MDAKQQHMVGIGLLLVVFAAIGWHLWSSMTETPVSGDYVPYYGPPVGPAQTLAQENPEESVVLPSVPNATTAGDRFPHRARVFDLSAPVLQNGGG